MLRLKCPHLPAQSRCWWGQQPCQARVGLPPLGTPSSSATGSAHESPGTVNILNTINLSCCHLSVSCHLWTSPHFTQQCMPSELSVSSHITWQCTSCKLSMSPLIIWQCIMLTINVTLHNCYFSFACQLPVTLYHPAVLTMQAHSFSMSPTIAAESKHCQCYQNESCG